MENGMIKTRIAFVDYITLQNELDNSFGTGVFTIIVDKDGDYREYFLEYEDTVDQLLVDQALIMTTNDAIDFLKRTKLKSYSKIEYQATKVLEQYNKPKFTPVDVQQATDWLADQSTPVPASVLYVAMNNSISDVDAATLIIDADENYDAFVTSVSTIKHSGQAQIMQSIDVNVCKQETTIVMDQLKNLI